MKLRRLFLIGLLAALPLWGCGDDDETTGPDITELAGTWIASPTTDGTSLVLTPNLAPSQAVDVVNTLQGEITLTITTAERFTLAVNIANLPTPVDEVVTGDFEITGNNRATLTNDDDPDDPLTATFNLSGDVLNVVVQDAELIDLTGDGQVTVLDAAEIDGTFARSG